MKTPLLLFLLVPAFAFAQKVKINEYDKFIKRQRIEFEPLTILSSPTAKVALTYNCQGNNLYVQLSGYGWGVTTINMDNPVIFLLANDSTVTVQSTGVQTYEVGSAQNTYNHQYQLSLKDVEALSQQRVVGIRKYGVRNFTDMKVATEYADNFKKLSSMFIDELKKGKVLLTLKPIEIKNIANHVGDSVMFCTKIFNAEEHNPADAGPPFLYAVASGNNPVLTTIMWEQDRKSFAYQPEVLYHNKEVCIRGVVQLYQGRPRVIIRSREQVTVKTPIKLEEAAMYAGDSISTQGKVVRTQYFNDIADAPTVLFMGGGNASQMLTAVIEAADRKKFIAQPENNYLNKEVIVTGKVVMVNNLPQIMLRQGKQIEEVLGGSLASVSSHSGQQATTAAAVTKTTAPANRMAAFPGGAQAWKTFMTKNLRVPLSLGTGYKRTVVVRFKVNADGSITDHEIVESAGKKYDYEVLEVLKKMPKWIPEIQNGQPVAVSYKLPITFERIENTEPEKK